MGEGRTSGRRRIWPRFRARMRYVWRRLLTLTGPFLLTLLLLWLLGVFFGRRVSYELTVMSLASFLGLGTTVILTPMLTTSELTIPIVDYTVEIHLGTWHVAVWVMYLNMAAAFLYAYNLDLLEKIPWLGTYLRRARKNARRSLDEHPWIRRMAEFGIVLFVVSPLPGSGQLGGCFVGRVLGLSKRTVFLVVSLAGVGVATIYAMFGSYIKGVLDHAQIGPWIRVGGFALLLAMAWFIFKLLKYLVRQEPEEETPDDEEGDDGGDENPTPATRRPPGAQRSTRRSPREAPSRGRPPAPS